MMIFRYRFLIIYTKSFFLENYFTYFCIQLLRKKKTNNEFTFQFFFCKHQKVNHNNRITVF